MTLQKQIVSVPFGQGVDTKSDTKALPPGKLTTLENGVFTKTGAVEKRYGVLGYAATNAVGATIATSTRGLGVLDSQMLMVADSSGHELYAWAGATNRWTDVGRMPTVASSERVIFSTATTAVQFGDVAEHAGLEVHVWYESTTRFPRFLLRDRTTGSIVATNLVTAGSAGNCASLRVIWSSTVNAFLVVSKQAGFVYVQSISSSGVLGTMQTISSTATNDSLLDVVDTGSTVWLAYSVGTTIILAWFTTYGGSVTSTTVTASWTTLTLFQGNGGTVVAAGSTSGNAIQSITWISGATLYALTTLATVGGTVGHIAGVNSSGTTNVLVLDVTSATTWNCVTYKVTMTAGAYVSSGTVCRSVALASRPFVYGGKVYLLTCYSGALQKVLFLFDSSGTVYGQALRWTANGIRPANILPGATLVTGTTTRFLTCGEQAASTRYASPIYGARASQCAIEFDFGAPVQAIKQGPRALFAGSIMGEFDGMLAHEFGFLLLPEQPTNVTAAAGGGLSAGSYLFAFVYEWQDPAGQIHRSAPCIPVTQVVAAGQSINFSAPMLRVTNRSTSNPVIVRIYRSTVNGSTLYNTGETQTNDPTADTWSMSTSLSDATIQTNAPIYSTGAADSPLAHSDPPACVALCNYRGRVFAAQGSRLWPSLEHFTEEPVAWNQDTYVDVDPGGGDITALAVLDEKLIAFKASSIYVLSGNGPDNNGLNNDYQKPFKLATDVGAVSPAGIAVTAMGILFKSAQGFYLLDRSMATHYVGAPVEAYNALTVTSAQVITAQYHVRFTTSAGTTLVFDYGNGQWSTFTNQAAVGGCVWNGLGVYVDSSAVVWVDNKGVFTDNAPSGAITQIKLKAVTGWLTFAAVQGFQRVRRVMPLGDYKGAHTLTVKVAYDYNEVTWDETATIDATTILTADAKKVYQFGIHLAQQKCEAIRLSIEDTQSSAFNEGMSLTALSFEVGVKEGAFKFPTTKRLGTV